LERQRRKLAAILAADVAGYARLMADDELGTLARLKQLRAEVIDPKIAQFSGQIVGSAGDSLLIEFSSAVDAVQCSFEIQQTLAVENAGFSEEKRMAFRIGVNLGDVIVEGGTIYGDGVNIAARLEKLAEPGGICVGRSIYDQVKGKLPYIYSNIGDQHVHNIPEPVGAYRVQIEEHAKRARLATPPSKKPSIAVLPLENMSGDPGQQYLSDGITEDIITELSRFRNLSVASRHASFHLKGKGASFAQVVRDLSANYVVEGSVQKRRDRIRITVQLIDAKLGNHLWAERYDRQFADVFAVQDEMVLAIVATLEGRIVADAAEVARKKPTESWSAYDCLLQGRALCNYYREREAVPFFARATEIDPNFATAHAWLALALVISYSFGDQAEILVEAAEAAEKALILDSNDANVHWANAMVMLWQRQHNRAGLHFDRAIALNPADMQIRADRASWLRYVAQPEQALAATEEALKQGSLAPHWFWVVRGQVLFDLKRYDEAIAALNSMSQQGHIVHSYLAATHAYRGDSTKALQALAQAQGLRPSICVQEFARVEPHVEANALKHLLDGLRSAGMPE
jgi:TolB-like protein